MAIPHDANLLYSPPWQPIMHFDWTNSSCHCFRAAEIIHFRLIRIHSNARKFHFCVIRKLNTKYKRAMKTMFNSFHLKIEKYTHRGSVNKKTDIKEVNQNWRSQLGLNRELTKEENRPSWWNEPCLPFRAHIITIPVNLVSRISLNWKSPGSEVAYLFVSFRSYVRNQDNITKLLARIFSLNLIDHRFQMLWRENRFRSEFASSPAPVLQQVANCDF